MAAAVVLIESGCSDIGFPAVHDMPAPRADTPLTPDQVKQATDDLISQRDHLSSEAQAAAQANNAANAAAPAANAPASNPPARGATAANAASGPKKKPAKAAPPVAAEPTVTGTTQTAGADAKP